MNSLNINLGDSIKVVNDFLPLAQFKQAAQYCCESKYNYGEQDHDDAPVVGMVHNISESDSIYKLFQKKISDEFPIVSSMRLYRMYINCFAPSENPYFHTDNDTGFTFLYYPQENWKLNDGGETQFLINESIYGVLPLPNRIVKFDAAIMHKATPFRNSHRFTLAIKYE